MRVGEAIGLGRSDIDWGEVVIRIRDSKFGKVRDLSVSASTIAALRSYADSRDRRDRFDVDRFYVSLAGTPVDGCVPPAV